MQKIFKYILNLVDNQVVDIFLPATLLSVEEQRGDIVLYAIVDDESNATIPIDIAIIGTGNVIRQNLSAYRFMGTVKLMNGGLMFHVFAKHGVRIIDNHKITEPMLVDA